MPTDEQVLVIERSIYEELGEFHGLCFDVVRYLERIFEPGVACFMLRSDAEKNPNFKQLIPYVIMTCGDQVFSYVRGKRAGEQRLAALRSLGIGGHINPVDEMPLFGDLRDTYLTAVRREVDEEVAVNTAHHDRIAALLNDDTNEVGKVHLGVVHLWRLDEPKVEKREQMITQAGFMPLADLRTLRDTMETWSQLCLDGLEQMNH